MTAIRFALAALGLVLILPTAAYAQTGAVEGQVVDAANDPVANINISLQGTSYGAATNAEGHFSIARVPVGTYTLVASGVGFELAGREVAVRGGETVEADFVLSRANEELDELVVQGSVVNAFTVPESDFVARLPIADLENPQVYSTITSELLESQVVTSFDDALTNAPGLYKLWESTGRGGDGAGYYSLRGFAVQPTMINGLPALTNGTLDPASIDRIEVIKGPSGTLFGSSLISYGGLINVVTKQPYRSFGAEVSYRMGSYGLNTVTADVNAPIDEAERVAVRAVGAYRTSSSYQDAGFNESFFVAPSLSYFASDRLSFLVQTEFNHTEQTNQTMLFLHRGQALQTETLGELGYDYERSYTNNDLTITTPTLSLQGQMNYTLSESWTSQTALSRSSAKSDGYYTYLYEAPTGNPRVFARYVSRQNATTLGTDLQQNFVGDFDLGGFRNRLVVGVDYLHLRELNNSTGYVGLGTVTVGADDPAGISRSAADAALADASVTTSTTEQNVYSAYASDVIDVTPWLSTMLSLRVDRFDSEGDVTTEDDDYDQTALSPKLGLVVQPIVDKVSVFANYMNGFSNVAPRVQDDGSTVTFAPEQADQWEVGVKTNLADDRLIATLSFYDITVSDVVRQDPERVNFFVQDGEDYSRGVEASIVSNPVEGLNLIVGYSYNDSEVVETDNADYEGRRPESAGPEHLGNAWITYRLPFGVLEGLGVGVGGNYASENVILNRATTGTFTLPSYTIVNASVFYSTDAYRLDLKVNNIGDEEYYKGWSTINPQAPRNVTASFSYRF